MKKVFLIILSVIIVAGCASSDDPAKKDSKSSPQKNELTYTSGSLTGVLISSIESSVDIGQYELNETETTLNLNIVVAESEPLAKEAVSGELVSGSCEKTDGKIMDIEPVVDFASTTDLTQKTTITLLTDSPHAILVKDQAQKIVGCGDIVKPTE